MNVIFCRINSSDIKQMDRYCCSVTENIYRAGDVYVQARSKEHAEKLDSVMWRFRDISFIPHVILPVSIDNHCMKIVCIGYDNLIESVNNMGKHTLINLSNSAYSLDIYCAFKMIYEFVLEQNEEQKLLSRNIYRRYKERNMEISVTDIT